MKRIIFFILAIAAVLAGSVSCQKANDVEANLLPTVALNIIPDFSDGSVYSFSDDGSFFLRISVTPKTYIDKLINNDGLVCKADFRSVITKAIPENPDFTVVGKIASASVEEGYMTTCFELGEEKLTKLYEFDYVVSFSLEDKDGVHCASTTYVPIDNPREGWGGDVYAAVDLGLSVLWCLCNIGATKPQEFGSYFTWGKACKFQEPQLRTPTIDEWDELKTKCDWIWTDNYEGTDVSGCIVRSRVNNNYIFLPAAGYDREGDSRHIHIVNVGIYGDYWSSSINESDSQYARYLYFKKDFISIQGKRKPYSLQSLRPVKDK